MRAYQLMLIMGFLYWSFDCISSQEKTNDPYHLREMYALFGLGSSFALHSQTTDPLHKEIAAEYAKRKTPEEKQKYLQAISNLTKKHPEWLDLIPLESISIAEQSNRRASPNPRHDSLTDMIKGEEK